jgi:hypothetical protein
MTPIYAASHVPADNPRVVIFVVGAFLCLAITMLPAVVKRDVSFGRRCYWGGTAGTMVCVFFAALPDWLGGLVFGAATLFGMALAAYFTSSYIKIGGRIYAFHAADERPDPRPGDAHPVARDPDYDPIPDQYGTGVSATRIWWMMVPGAALCVLTVATNLGHDAKIGLAIGAAIVLVVAGFGYGVMDASWKYPIARGQYVQFVLVAVVTAGVFTVSYLAGFGIGRRWPMRPKRSLERAVHPRFRDEA